MWYYGFMPIILFFLFFLPTVLEGIGIRIYQNLFFLLYYLILPVPLYFYILFTRTPLRLPRKIGVLFLLYLFLTNFSFFFASANKQVSFENLLTSLSFFLLFLFFYSLKDHFKKHALWLIMVLGLFFVVYSLCIPVFKYLHYSFLIPIHEKQTVLAIYGSHNHLGDFLGLVLLILLFSPILKNRLAKSILSLVIFFSMVLAFSRSAYLAFFVILLLFFIQHRNRIGRKYLMLGFISLGLLIYLSFSVGSDNLSKKSSLYPLRQYAEKKLSIIPRDFLSGRDKFTLQALSSIRKNPLLGIGPGNFAVASMKYNTGPGNLFITDSAHNIFLEVAVERGIPALICFLLIVLFFLLQAVKRKDLYGYLFIYLLVNFQTDYTYQTYLFYLLFIMVAATLYHEKEDYIIPSWVFGIFAITLFGFLTSILTSAILFERGSYLAAINYYPYSKYAYLGAIQTTKDDALAQSLIERVDTIVPNDAGVAMVSGAYYLKTGRKVKALTMYEKAYRQNHLIAFPIMKQIYFLKKQVKSDKEADQYLREIIGNLKYVFIPDSFKKEFGEFCLKANEKICEETGWYKSAPKPLQKKIIKKTNNSVGK